MSIRFRQQLNENSKELCWHHVIPEMNHNELVGWAGGAKHLPWCSSGTSDHERSYRCAWRSTRRSSRGTPNTSTRCGARATTLSPGNCTLINLGDWVSYYLAEKKGVDPTGDAVINMLKGKLAEVK